MSKAKELRALQEELYLLAVGASGCSIVEEDPENGAFVYHTIGCESWVAWIVAIERRFEITDKTQYVIAGRNLEHLESIDGAAKYLYEHGCRAGNARPR